MQQGALDMPKMLKQSAELEKAKREIHEAHLRTEEMKLRILELEQIVEKHQVWWENSIE